MTKIVIIQGHPDPAGGHLCHALADAYAQGAEAGGHPIKRIEAARLDFAMLRQKIDFETGAPSADVKAAQDAIAWADHLVVVFPLWLGTLPALFKGFLEQVLRPGFAFDYGAGRMPGKRLKGRSARIVVTMGMPAQVYRWYFRAHGLKNLKRNVLGFCGIAPIRESLFGMVEAASDAERRKWLEAMRDHGRRAA